MKGVMVDANDHGSSPNLNLGTFSVRYADANQCAFEFRLFAVVHTVLFDAMKAGLSWKKFPPARPAYYAWDDGLEETRVPL